MRDFKMRYTVLMLAALTMVSACGVKPGDVEGADTHPRTYPDVRHDPLPNGGPAATRIR